MCSGFALSIEMFSTKIVKSWLREEPAAILNLQQFAFVIASRVSQYLVLLTTINGAIIQEQLTVLSCRICDLQIS